jgi:hypothetical protein
MNTAAKDIRVLYLDHWTLGLHNFHMYDGMLRDRGCSTRLFHIGSYRSESAPREVIDGIECRDVSFYGSRNLGRILDVEKPDVVVALNHFELFERSMFKAARNRGIPSVYIMHGVRLPDIGGYEQFYGANTGLARRLQKIPKYYDLMRMYAAAHLERDPLYLFRPHLYRLGWRYLRSPIREIFQPTTTADTEPDIFLLYSEFDRRLFRDYYGLPAERLKVVGNMKLDGLFKRAQEIATPKAGIALRQSLGLAADEKFVLNLEDAMVEMNPKAFTHEMQTSWYQYMEKAVREAGYRFIVKAHPGSDLARLKTLFGPDSTSIVVQAADLDTLIAQSEAVVGTISTALINAVALEKTVLACEWLDTDMLKSPNFVVEYGGAVSCRTQQDFENALRDLDACERQLAATRQRMITEFVTYRDGLACERVADEIVRIAKEARAWGERAVA